MKRALLISGVLLAAPFGSLAAQGSAQPAYEGAPSIPHPKAAPRINNPLNPVQRFLQMTPEEQERFMEKANPQQQERLREAIERYKALSPAQRDWLFRQYQILNSLPPAKQALISREIAYFNNKLPDERRGTVGEELVKLHRMTEGDRAARLASEDFKTKYSPEEQELLSNLAENLPAEYPLRR
jgi:hypothetical protein